MILIVRLTLIIVFTWKAIPSWFTGKRPIKRDQVETDNNWEIDFFGVATAPRPPVDQHLDPVVIRILSMEDGLLLSDKDYYLQTTWANIKAVQGQ